MADPLRRTLLAKLRGKKSKKEGTAGGGYGSTTAAGHGSREGKEKVLQTQRDEARQVMLLTELECTTERMSTYENCVDGAMVQAGRVVIVRQGRAPDLAGARPQERSSGGRVRVNEELLGVPLQRAVHFGGHVVREENLNCNDSYSAKIVLSTGFTHDGPRVHRKHFISVPRQYSVGDSIGFGDSSDGVLHRARVESNAGLSKAPEGRTTAAESDATEAMDRGHSPHIVTTAVAVRDRNTTCSDNSHTLETAPSVYAPPVCSNCASRNTDESVLIRNVESYGPECAGELRGTTGALQSPTFFPTELHICDISVESPFVTEHSLRCTVNSEDEDYYDNEILPFYETVRAKSDGKRADAPEQPSQDKGQLDDSNSAQETDRLRNQLKEAYYLLISAMNDINLDVQQITSGLATSSCSSHSRDSLCSRLSAKNIDSDCWSSGGLDHSPQQVSDTDSLLLCLNGKLESGLKGSILKSRSMVNLSMTLIRRTLLRSASDGAIGYPSGPSLCDQAQGMQGPEISYDTGDAGTKEGKGTRRGELSDPSVLYNDISSDELLQDPGRDEQGEQLNESSGSVNSLTSSSDSNTDTPAHQGHENKQEHTEVREERSNSVSKGHGVTVNKMQEWMHKGRLLSSEMKQRIEGSALPTQVNLGGCKAGTQTSSQRVKSVKVKSPRQQQPGRKASGQVTSGSSQSETSHPPSSDNYHPPPLIVNSVWWRSTLQSCSSGCKAKGRDTSDLFAFPFTTL